MPKLTCVMTTYNEDTKIAKESIDSILTQTFADFELIIVVDNPQNGAIIDLVNNYSDRRIKVIVNEKNLGLPLSLNKGIAASNSEYIARMDADDIAEPTRFQIQIDYLREHTDIDVVGTFCTVIDEQGNTIRIRSDRPYKYEHIRECAKYMNVFVHPSLMGKAEIFKRIKYRNLRYAQDYDFTSRLIEMGYKLENIPVSLIKYRQQQIVSEEKLVRQRVTCYYIQKLFSENKLCNVDIVSLVDNKLSEINIRRTSSSIRKWNDSLMYFHRKMLVHGIVYLYGSYCTSVYQKRYISNIIKYSIKRKFLIFKSYSLI